jgi:hypothetical protein
MCREPDRRGAGDDENPIVVRSLTREYRLFADDPALRRELSYLAASPEIEGAALQPVPIRFEPCPPFHRAILANGSTLEGDPPVLRDFLHRHVGAGMLQEVPDGVLVHGASIAVGDGRLIVLGDKAFGKTTLVLRLLAEAFHVEGDEHVALRESDVIARPRRLRVKQGSLSFVPSLAKRIAASPYIVDYVGNRIYSVEPTLAGAPWRIAPARAAHFVFIEPNHGGRSMLTPMPFDAAFQLLLRHAIVVEEDRIKIALRLRRHLAGAKAWRLLLGDHENAVEKLARLAS